MSSEHRSLKETWFFMVFPGANDSRVTCSRKQATMQRSTKQPIFDNGTQSLFIELHAPILIHTMAMSKTQVLSFDFLCLSKQQEFTTTLVQQGDKSGTASFHRQYALRST